MKISRVLLMASWGYALLFLLIHFSGILPKVLSDDPTLLYVCHLFCVLIAIAGVYFSCRFFQFERVKRYITEKPNDDRLGRMQLFRTAIISAAVVSTSVLNMLAGTQTTFYCAIICLLGSFLCWPRNEAK
ncbi:MAG: hypothetical protein IJ816_01125 [Alloprevotella sp.]|nr:hypothetical protein [Alloprevotella sp.]